MVTIKYRESFKKDYFETQVWQEGNLICGIDEVGRGCLAGPVVTAAVILFPFKKSRLVKDSKLMDPQELEKAYSWIIKNSWYTTGILNHRSITEHNIYHATLKAMRRSLMQLFSVIPTLPTTIVVDAMPVSLHQTAFEHINVVHFPFGERKSSSIAAASIVAKVTRDTLMRKLHTLFPAYHLDKHKGYGTQVHQEALRLHGASIIHRPHFVENKKWLASEQLSLHFNKPTQKLVA